MTKLIKAAAFLLLSLAMSTGAAADRDHRAPLDRSSQNGRDQPARAAPRRGVNEVIDMVERRYGGKVVGVTRAGDHYRVRLLQRDGRVRTLRVPISGY